jgi:hypothetical protein
VLAAEVEFLPVKQSDPEAREPGMAQLVKVVPPTPLAVRPTVQEDAHLVG